MTILRSFRSLHAKLKVIGFLLFALRHSISDSDSNNNNNNYECEQSAQEDKQTNCPAVAIVHCLAIYVDCYKLPRLPPAINYRLNIAYFGYR